MSDQSGRVQVLSGQAVAEETWAEVVEPAGPVDEVDRAQSRALLSQMHAHRNAYRQRLQSGVQVACHYQPAADGVWGGENATGHRRVPLGPRSPLQLLGVLTPAWGHGRRPVYQGDQ